MPRAFASPLWRNGAFVRIWTAATISIFGSLITRMALPFVAILVLSAGPFEVAILRSLDVLAATGKIESVERTTCSGRVEDGLDLVANEPATE